MQVFSSEAKVEMCYMKDCCRDCGLVHCKYHCTTTRMVEGCFSPQINLLKGGYCTFFYYSIGPDFSCRLAVPKLIKSNLSKVDDAVGATCVHGFGQLKRFQI